MKPLSVKDMEVGEEYAIGSLFKATHVYLVNIEDHRGPTVSSILGSADNEYMLLVAVLNEETGFWCPALIRVSQVISTWKNYEEFLKSDKKERSLSDRFRILGIEVVHQPPYVRITASAAEHILNMLEASPGLAIKGTTLKVVK